MSRSFLFDFTDLIHHTAVGKLEPRFTIVSKESFIISGEKAKKKRFLTCIQSLDARARCEYEIFWKRSGAL